MYLTYIFEDFIWCNKPSKAAMGLRSSCTRRQWSQTYNITALMSHPKSNKHTDSRAKDIALMLHNHHKPSLTSKKLPSLHSPSVMLPTHQFPNNNNSESEREIETESKTHNPSSIVASQEVIKNRNRERCLSRGLEGEA